MLNLFGPSCRDQKSDYLITEQDQPERTSLECLTCRCKQELVIASDDWKIPKGDLRDSLFCFALKTELLVQIPGSIKMQVQIWNTLKYTLDSFFFFFKLNFTMLGFKIK